MTSYPSNGVTTKAEETEMNKLADRLNAIISGVDHFNREHVNRPPTTTPESQAYDLLRKVAGVLHDVAAHMEANTGDER